VSAAIALLMQGNVVLFQGDPQAAQTYCEDSVAAARQAGHTWQLGMSLYRQARALVELGDHAGARRLFD